jgi:hypothetical protein
MRLMIEKISSERVLMFKELTENLIKSKMFIGGFEWENKEGKWILFQGVNDLKNGYIFINYREVWSFFEIGFNMNYQQIQEFMKERLRLDKKIRVNTTFPAHTHIHRLLWLDKKKE